MPGVFSLSTIIGLMFRPSIFPGAQPSGREASFVSSKKAESGYKWIFLSIPASCSAAKVRLSRATIAS